MNETRKRLAEILEAKTNYGPGRPPFPETRETMRRMLERIQTEPGIPSAKLARELGIGSAQCSTLARRMEDWGLLEVENRNQTLYLRLADL